MVNVQLNYLNSRVEYFNQSKARISQGKPFPLVRKPVIDEITKSTEKLKSSFLELVNFEDTQESEFCALSTKCVESEEASEVGTMDLFLRDIVWNGLKITPQNF